ncbi:MAG: 3-deoxy-8-phosphooctulonate synthase [Myxococcales bacterium]|nr:3-deoxy-8-phosphooctulonate synthase [Myxococcales bacterium]
MITPWRLGDINVGQDFFFVLGPCVLQPGGVTERVADGIAEVCARVGVRWVFKASFDKANRSSGAAGRGPGLDEGLDQLRRLRQRLGVPLTTDVHLPGQAALVAQVADLLQIPAFLCRQTDLLVACAATGRPVNVKKGQFMAPGQMRGVVGKLGGAAGVMLTERGTSFGYNDLVVDLRGLVQMRDLDVPVCFDATHSVQAPGALGDASGGERRFVGHLARAAAAVGIDALFAEVHDDPASSPSDAATMLPLSELEGLLRGVLAVRGALPAGRA